MKIRELIKEIPFDKFDQINHIALKAYENDIYMCDEFVGAKNLTIVDSPIVKSIHGDKNVLTLLLSDNIKLNGNVVLYSIFMTPPVDGGSESSIMVRGLFPDIKR